MNKIRVFVALGGRRDALSRIHRGGASRYGSSTVTLKNRMVGRAVPGEPPRLTRRVRPTRLSETLPLRG